MELERLEIGSNPGKSYKENGAVLRENRLFLDFDKLKRANKSFSNVRKNKSIDISS
jgi:hypothetical protein